MAAKIFRINYKSDFILTMNSDAGWAIPFCIKFWTSVPSRAYFASFDGTTYTHCAYDPSEPTKLVVQFDDHHLPIGDLNYQIAYHFTVADFPNDTEDEVINPATITTEIDGETYHVMLDFTGETAPEIEFNLPAYANEAERIQNELQRQQNEADRIAAELQREQATAAAVQGAENVNAQLNGTTLVVTNRQGVSTSVNTKGEQGEQGPVGPEGPQGEQGVSIVSFLPKSETSTTLIYTITYSNGYTQDVAIPKGPKGDTGATGPTGPQGPQGDTGVSITGFIETGETETATLYNITFSNGTTQAVAIPKGEKGDQGPVGPQGPQGPMGDVAVITPEQQAAFTMYSTTGQNTNGPMTQKAVTDALVGSSISYDNSLSGLASNNVQDAIDESSSYIEHTEIDIASISAVNFGLWGDKWHSTTNNIVTKKVDVSEGEKYYIVADSLTTQAFFMSTYNPVNNASVAYQLDVVAAGESDYVTVPNGMNYMVFQDDHLRTSGTPSTIFPLNVTKFDVKNIKDVVDNNSTNISLLENVIGEMIDTTSFPSVQAFMTDANGGTWYTSSSTNRGKFIPVIAGERYRIIAAERYSYFAFLKSNSYGRNNTPVTNFASNESCHLVRNGYVTDMIAPSDAQFLFISVLNGTIDCTPTIQLFRNYNKELKLEASKLASINACRNAHVISESRYIYAFPVDSLILKDNEFIINYNASETDTDADTTAEVVAADHCLDKVSILDYTTINGIEPSYTIEKSDQTVIQGFVGWTSRILVGNDICVMGVCRQTNKNPFYVYAILEGDEESFVYKECKLKYTPTGGSQTTVDFTVNNYRQMLVNCGFASSYLASQGEAVDNCNLCYENGVYYIFTATSPSSALPLMCLKSTDLETWEVVGVVLSNNMRINEVSAVVKDGVGYIMYRTWTQGSFANFAIYNIANNVLINSGVFNDAVESRPDVFTFEDDVYLAYNVLPSTYNSATSSVRPDQGGRNEINAYKVVDNNPIFFRRICNPTGLNYFRFRETPVYVDSMNTWWNQGAIYMAYSEDRRHLYRRQFANVSIADVTAVFADSEECN